MMDEGILVTLRALRDLFKDIGASRWTTFIDELSNPAVIDCRFLQRVQSLIGGMGSITDIYISKSNGFNVDEEDEEELNKQLMSLAESLYQRVKAEMVQLGCS